MCVCVASHVIITFPLQYTELTAFRLSGPAIEILADDAQKLANKWKLHYTRAADVIQVKGQFDCVHHFRMELEAYGKEKLVSRDPRIPSIPAQPGDLEPSPTPIDSSSDDSGQIFKNMSPDVLALLAKQPGGEIPGVHYDIKAGTVHIDSRSKEELEDRISKFQAAYQGIISSGRVKAEAVEVPQNWSDAQATTIVDQFNEKYNQCAFTYYETDHKIKVVSTSSRQFDQAKKLLVDALRSSPPPLPRPGAKAVFPSSMVIPLSDGRKFTLKKANIVEEEVDIIVNAANERLDHAGGVAGALNKASNGQLQMYSDSYVQQKGNVKVGHVALTHGGELLKCKYVVHAVGPDSSYQPSECRSLLVKVVHAMLNKAEKYNAVSIAIPAISSGIFGVDKDLVATTLIDTILAYLFTKPPPTLADIRIVIIDDLTYNCFARHFIQKKTPPARPAPSLEGRGRANSAAAGFRQLHKQDTNNPTRPPASERRTSMPETRISQEGNHTGYF